MRASRSVLREAGGESPPAYSPDYLFACNARELNYKLVFSSFNESNTRSLKRALARRDITVPAGQSKMAAIS